ncbi:unnamed protein product [Cuscuta epithymum]|uniref:Uncharacterized protein n=1 Tax=Cuscuta epithymum TaxID=186058 RepID=A0AAV0DSN8_9ASTE|nr:unnamed protein product [Cuscuta epithymum]
MEVGEFVVRGPADLVDKVKGITGNLCDVSDLPFHVGSHGLRHVLKPVEARILVGQRGADPGLHVAHLPLEIYPSPEMLQLRHAQPQLLHRVAHLLHAVLQRRPLPYAAAPDSAQKLRRFLHPDEAD